MLARGRELLLAQASEFERNQRMLGDALVMPGPRSLIMLRCQVNGLMRKIDQ